MSEKLDKLFKDRFEHFEVQPPPGAWETINAQLPTASPTVWWWPLRGLMALVLVAFMFPFPVGEPLLPGEGLSNDLAVGEEGSGQEASFIAVVPSENKDQGSATLQKMPNGPKSESASEEMTKQSGTPKEVAESAVPQGIAAKPVIDVAVLLTEKNEKPKETRAKEGSITGGGPPLGEMVAVLAGPQGEEAQVVAGQKSQTDGAAMVENSSFMDQLSPFWLNYKIGEGDLMLDQTKIIERDYWWLDGKAWQLGLSGNLYTAFVNITPNAQDETIISESSDRGFDSNRIGWSFGVNAYKSLNQNWRLGISANWQMLRMGNAFEHQSTVPDEFSFELHDSRSGVIRTDKAIDETYVAVRYQMVSTEIGVTYWWSSFGKKRGIEVSAGMSYAFQQRYQIGQGAEWQKESMDEFIPTLSVGLPMQQKLGKSTRMEISPFVRYQLKEINHPTGLFGWTPYTVGLRLGWLK